MDRAGGAADRDSLGTLTHRSFWKAGGRPPSSAARPAPGGSQSRKPIPSLLADLAATLTAIVVGLHPAWAQDATGPYGMQFFVTPYLWLAGVHATTMTPLPRRPEVDSDVSVIQLLSHLDGVPVMGSVEMRQGPLGLLGDVIHLPVATNITTHDIFYQGGNAALRANTGTGVILYRALEDPVQFADAGLGFRAWGFSMNVNLNAGLLPAASVSRSAGWTDPLLAGRYHRDLGNGFGLTAYGDVGGFGVGAHIDWQVMGTVDYAPNPWLNLRLGYRSLNFNYQASESNLGFNVHMRGPILAGTFRF
jgi:hypothetical protein